MEHAESENTSGPLYVYGERADGSFKFFTTWTGTPESGEKHVERVAKSAMIDEEFVRYVAEERRK